MFTLDHGALQRLAQINNFPVRQDEMIFFGLRGCLPLDPEDHEFRAGQKLVLAEVDYVHPRCTLGQWLPAEKKIAVFPGSTAPHLKHIKAGKVKGGSGVNMLITGYYTDYEKGFHRAGSSTGHEAFRQTEGRPLRRSADDFDFDTDDRVEIGNPFDNLHCAWSMGVEHDDYASAGCQVVVGFPRCEKRGDQPEVGPWRAFRKRAYEEPQETFSYILLSGRDALKASGDDRVRTTTARLRFGSQGPLVVVLQEALGKLTFYEGKKHDRFDGRTMRAVLDFQTATFGPASDDGIVGPMTARALGLDWPEV